MTTAQEVINIAQSQIGYTEYPPDSNNTKYGEWYGMNYEPWCDMFVSWVFAQADASNLIGGRFAYCPYHERWFRDNGLWVDSGAQPGDVVFFGSPIASHIGIVKEPIDGGAITIEGNTSTSSDDNGGAVMERVRYEGGYIRGYGRPKYDGGQQPEERIEDEDMQCLFQPDGEGYMVWYDGTNLHALDHPDEMEAIKTVYRECYGREIPCFTLGTEEAPWAHRFMDAVRHGAPEQPHM